NGESGPWSATNSFTIDTQAPPVPALSSPVHKAFTTSRTPTLIVIASTAASQYQFQISVDDGFDSPVVDGRSATVSYAVPSTLPLQYGEYYWRARAIDAAGNVSDWSVTRQLGISFQANPVDGALIVGSTPTLTWAAVNGALEYNLQVDDEDDFADPLLDRSLPPSTSFTTAPLDYGTYYWRIKVRTAAGWSDWALPWRFTLAPASSAAPTLSSPANAAFLNDTTPTLNWVSGLSDDFYEVRIDNINTFASPEQGYVTAAGEAGYTATPLTDGMYYWQVRTFNYLGVSGPWSATRTFTVDTVPPAAPALSAPADNTSVIGTPTFSWAATTGATQYQFEYADDPSFTNIVYTSAAQAGLKIVPPTMTATTYYWHVKARDAAGNWSEWSSHRTVTIGLPTPVAPTLSTPANTLVVNTSTPVFTWNAVAYGNTYRIEIATASTFGTTIVQSFTGDPDVRTYTATPLGEKTYYWRVRAFNAADPAVASPWSATWSFKVDSIAPASPALSAPAANASVTGTPAFSWVASTSATKYQFQYADDVEFTNIVYTSAAQTGLTITPPAMTFGEYYWRVKARDAAGNWGEWSSARKVTIKPPAPAAPVLTAPASGLATSDPTQVFTWNAVTNGNTYKWELATTSSFGASTIQSFTGDPGVYTYTATPLTDGTYYWHVQAFNYLGVSGPWSAYRTLKVDTVAPAAPALSAPAANASVIGTPTFSWTATTGATQYQFEYADDPSFTTIIYTSAAQTGLTIVPPTMTAITHYWHVKARDAAGNWGEWSSPRTVTIGLPTPVAPTLSAPANTAVVTATPVLTWNAVAYGNTYRIEIATASTFGTTIVQSFTGEPGVRTYTATPLGQKTYYWRVRAFNAADPAVASPWSATRSFTVDSVAPAVPVLSAPAAGATANGTPTFSWTASTGAAKYQFEYDDNADFSSQVYTSGELSTTSILPPAMSLGTYSWHVRARDAAGNWSNWSTARIVNIVPIAPAAPSLVSPASGSISANPAPTLTWTAMTGAVRYQVQIDNNSTFASPAFDDNATVNNIAPSPKLADGVYYWRVRQFNSLGGVSSWSPVWRLTIKQPIPVAPTLQSPIDGESNTTGLPAFSWDSVINGDMYEIQVDDDADFTSPVFGDTAETTNRSIPTALVDGVYYWRVRAINIYDTPGEWSIVRMITIDVSP
ncbi:MAG TPA: hypothetical protein VKP08_00635, partial [Anaerolineales bacterium]|nr:hypothetical protein [Anaerolineales bacterium]